MAMDIQIYSDTVCPWCFVGKRRLQRALDQRPDLKTTIVWRAFQLNPDMPSEGADRDEYIQAKFGKNGYGPMGDALRAAGLSVGIEFDLNRASRIPNTVDSHRLLSMAASVDRQPELSEVLFRQYFIDGLDIGDPDVLSAAAAEAGLDGLAVKTLLAGDEGRAEILQADQHARSMGISSVPTFVFDGRHTIVGAQDPDVFLQLFDLMKSEVREA
jgi:predicted DsbA family dithiol-disulfide isomerase